MASPGRLLAQPVSPGLQPSRRNRCLGPPSTLDSTFGPGGVGTLDCFGATDGATDLVVHPDGRIAVGGLPRNGTSNGPRLVRLDP